MSLSLVGLIPGSLRFASTWRELYLTPRLHIENDRVVIGFYALGLVFIGLIVLWTGFRKRERWAWFVMLVILLFFVFPGYVLRQLVLTYELKLGLSDFLQLIPLAWGGGNWQSQSIGILLGMLTFVVMLVALLLPVKAFFGRRPIAEVEDGSRSNEV